MARMQAGDGAYTQKQGRRGRMSLYYREQKHICGKDYATAGYMEVDL